jgi:adenylate cyclase class 2
MATEMEIKAHAVDFEAVKAKLSSLGGPPLAMDKDDAYWIAPADPGNLAASVPLSGVRIRREAVSGGGERILVTYKTKESRDGMEINDEQEFTVSDRRPFEELLARMGFKPGLRKRKQGWFWTINGITAELCRVWGRYLQGPGAADIDLGWFAELEIVDKAGGREAVDAVSVDSEAVRVRLEALLEKTELPRTAVEGRYYSEMLGEPDAARDSF